MKEKKKKEEGLIYRVRLDEFSVGNLHAIRWCVTCKQKLKFTAKCNKTKKTKENNSFFSVSYRK